VDSALLACGALIVHNLGGQRVQRLSDPSRLRLTRAAVVLLGLVSFVVASTGLSVHSLVAESSAFASAGLCVAGLLGLFTRFGGARAALLSLSAGGLSYVYATFVLESELAYLLSLGCALAGYALGALGVARVPLQTAQPPVVARDS
jgi:Na+/proline symporter